MEVDNPPDDGKCTALLWAGAIAAMIRRRQDFEATAAALDTLSSRRVSPMEAPVGAGAANVPADVGYVQALLNDHRGRQGLSLLVEDSVIGSATIAAINAAGSLAVQQPNNPRTEWFKGHSVAPDHKSSRPLVRDGQPPDLDRTPAGRIHLGSIAERPLRARARGVVRLRQKAIRRDVGRNGPIG
ncbi:hypothetical protein [Nocardia sp. NBC_00403]|uniref:hypothetical protein n=1 Tax=Nocardia sp. NBC_00403 TaxID=2975990 RepID=UPI002E23B04C